MTRHRTDPVSLVFGLVFVGFAVAAWSGAIRLDTVVDLRWVWPVLLIAGGLMLLTGLTRRGDEPAGGTISEPADETLEDPVDPAPGAGWEATDEDG